MGELREQLRLAAPLAVGQVGHQLLSLVDTAMLGRFSDVALAGAGIANGLLWAVTLLGMGVVMGMDSLVPQAVGSGEHRRASSLLDQGLRTALWLGLPLTAMAAATPLFMMLLGVEAAAREEATWYVLGRLPAIIPYLLFTAARSYLQAYSQTRPLVVAVVVANLLNVVANSALIFGDRALLAIGLPALGLPALGAVGAAIATSIVTWASLVIVYRSGRALQRREMPADSDEDRDHDGSTSMRAIVKLGWPVGLQLFAEVGLFALVGTLAGRLGTTSAAAHQLTLTVISFPFNAVVGIGAATSVRVGLAVGRGDHRAARRAGLVGMGLGVAILAPVGLMYLVIPHGIARLMSDQANVIAAAVPLFYVAALFQIGDAFQAIGAGALRGAGDTRSPMWAHLIGHYVVGLNVGLLGAFVLERGAVGLWWGLASGLCFAGLVVTWRFIVLSRRPIARAGG